MTAHPRIQQRRFQHRRFRQRQGVETQTLEGAAVLVDASRDLYFAINGIGARIWALLVQPHDVDALVSELVGRFDVDPQTCRADVDAFLAELEATRLVETVAADAAPDRGGDRHPRP